MSGSEPLKPCAECERLKREHEKDRAVLIRAMVDNEKIWRRRLEAAGLNIEDRAPSPVVAEVVKEMREFTDRVPNEGFDAVQLLDNVIAWADRLERGE